MRIRQIVPGNIKESEVSSSSDVFALGPATQLLQQIRSEHLYSTSSNCSLDKYCDSEECPSTSKVENHNDISSILEKLKSKTSSQNANASNADGELDMLTLNAASIQRQFQNIMDMTALTQIPDPVLSCEENTPSTSRLGKVNFVENSHAPETINTQKDKTDSNIPEDSTIKTNKKEDAAEAVKDKSEEDSKSRFEKEKILRSSKTSDKKKIKRSKIRKLLPGPKKNDSDKTQCKAVNQDDWRTINKVFEAERTLNLYLKHTAGLLVRRWGEYLAMTSEQVRQFEIENAKEAGMIGEVIEMLEDKDRYVWQLIDELHFW